MMHPTTSATLRDINRIETERRAKLAQNVLGFIGRKFRRKCPTSSLDISFVTGAPVIHIDGDLFDPLNIKNGMLTFIREYLADVAEITEGYTRCNLKPLHIEPGDTRSSKVVNALDTMSVDDPERAHIQADEILLQYLRDIGHELVADAYNRVVARASWW